MRSAPPLLLLLSLVLAAGCTPPDEGPPAPVDVAFPDGFLFGTSVSQWAVEGDDSDDGPVDSNWRRWTLMGRAVAEQQNADGNGFRARYADDLRLAKDLGLTHVRLGVDWSRVEPAPGVYDEAELQHIDDVVTAATDVGLAPALTLFTGVLPAWVQNPDASAPEGRVDLLASADPAVREQTLERWEGFVQQVVSRVADRVDVWIVLNEPATIASAGYLGGERPPGRLLDLDGATRLGVTLAFVQARAYDVIHANDDDAWVGLSMRGSTFRPDPADDADMQLAAESISYVFNDWLLRAVIDGELDVDLDGASDNAATTPPEGSYPELAGRADFVGVAYSGPAVVQPDLLLSQFHPLYGRPVYDVDAYDPALPHSGTGLEINAADLRATLERYAQWGLPLVVTENGTSRSDRPADEETVEPGAPLDDQAAMYVVEHLWEVARAARDGIDVRGYFHSTLADGFEHNEGLRFRYGAYRVDFTDVERLRTLTPVGEALRDVATAAAIAPDAWARWVMEGYPSDDREPPRLTTSEPPSF